MCANTTSRWPRWPAIPAPKPAGTPGTYIRKKPETSTAWASAVSRPADERRREGGANVLEVSSSHVLTVLFRRQGCAIVLDETDTNTEVVADAAADHWSWSLPQPRLRSRPTTAAVVEVDRVDKNKPSSSVSSQSWLSGSRRTSEWPGLRPPASQRRSTRSCLPRGRDPHDVCWARHDRATQRTATRRAAKRPQSQLSRFIGSKFCFLPTDLQVAWPVTSGVPTAGFPCGRLSRGRGPLRSLAGRGSGS